MDKPSLEKGLEVAKELTEELLKKLEVEAKVTVKEIDSSLEINIEGEDLGLLIGYHGDNLESLQLILGLLINRKLGGEEWIPISLDVGGWRDERLAALRASVEKIAPEIGVTRESYELPPMSSSQRRMVHLILADFPNLTSTSEGEEPNRRVVIKKADKSNES